MLTRRGFLGALVAAPVAAVAAVRTASPSFTTVRIPPRYLYARIRITPEMLRQQGEWNRIRSLELEAMTRDMQRRMDALFVDSSVRS